MTARGTPDPREKVLDETLAAEMAHFIKIAANPTRLRILWFLMGGESAVSEIEASTGVTQPTLSQQLSGLRAAEIVTTRRAHKAVFYTMTDAGVTAFLQWLATMFSVPKLIQPERVERISDPVGFENAAVFALLDDFP
jgi:DNA-binding transcriptional ArsR family regulator